MGEARRKAEAEARAMAEAARAAGAPPAEAATPGAWTRGPAGAEAERRRVPVAAAKDSEAGAEATRPELPGGAAGDDGPRNADLGGGLSRLLNAMCRGKRASTFSAESHYLVRKGRWHGRWREAVIDWAAWRLAGERGHCREAWDWHRRRGLYLQDDAGLERPVKPAAAARAGTAPPAPAG